MHDEPTKLCECGCGEPAPIAERTHRRYGWIKGQPKRFIFGHSLRGCAHTAESKAKISATLTGRPVSAETRAKISLSRKGYHHTDETREKMSLSRKGKPARRGPESQNWKGGRITRNGRPQTYVGLDHPMANSAGYVFAHRLVAAESTGRMLSSQEHVHHINEEPLDNRPENLVVVSNSQHLGIHALIKAGFSQTEAVSLVLGRGGA